MTTRLGLGRRADDGYVLRQTASIGLGPVRLLRGAPHLRCGAACLCCWPARGAWEEGVPAAGGAASRMAGARAPAHGRGLRCGRVHSARPGASCVAGDVRRRRGRESFLRTRGLSPAGADRTPPRGMSPPAYVMRSSAAAAEARDPRQSRRSPVGRCSGARRKDVERERPPSPSKIHE